MPVYLRPWSTDDAAALLTARWSSPDLDTQFSGVDLVNEAQAAHYVDTFLAFDDRRKNWAVIEDGVAVGNIGLSAIEMRHETAWKVSASTSAARVRGSEPGLSSTTVCLVSPG